MFTGIYLGHSYVTSYIDYIKNKNSDNIVNARYLPKHLRVCDYVEKILYHGQSGAKADDFKVPRKLIEQHKPKFAILELGLNDIFTKANPQSVVANISHVCKSLKTLGVSVIILCSILPCGDRGYYNKEILDKIKQTNQALYRISLTDSNTLYHNHRGFSFNNIHEWTRDGLHVNKETGRFLYWKSLRRAVFLAVSELHKHVRHNQLNKVINKICFPLFCYN